MTIHTLSSDIVSSVLSAPSESRLNLEDLVARKIKQFMHEQIFFSQPKHRPDRRECHCGQGIQHWEDECLDCFNERQKRFGLVAQEVQIRQL